MSEFSLEKKDIKSMTFAELTQNFLVISEKDYRVRQVYEWIVKGVTSFDEMSNIPKELREKLKSLYMIPKFRIRDKKVSKDSTVKYLFELCDGELIESVLMSYKHGYSVCISTQVGCKMGCLFCKTGKGGFSRNLAPSEMISQIEAIQNDMNIKISNVVLMGMGEPLDNYDNVLKFLRIISSKDHLNIGMRHISLSTCGIVDKIYKLADENLQLTLSVSLHAPDDSIRKGLMKIANRWSVLELIDACRYYVDVTGRRISFEYAMIEGVNDDNQSAEQLSSILKGMICHVNLIPLNKSDSKSLKRSSKSTIYRFKNMLEGYGINVTVRRTLGEDIEGACGQLRASHIPKEV